MSHQRRLPETRATRRQHPGLCQPHLPAHGGLPSGPCTHTGCPRLTSPGSPRHQGEATGTQAGPRPGSEAILPPVKVALFLGAWPSAAWPAPTTRSPPHKQLEDSRGSRRWPHTHLVGVCHNQPSEPNGDHLSLGLASSPPASVGGFPGRLRPHLGTRDGRARGPPPESACPSRRVTPAAWLPEHVSPGSAARTPPVPGTSPRPSTPWVPANASCVGSTPCPPGTQRDPANARHGGAPTRAWHVTAMPGSPAVRPGQDAGAKLPNRRSSQG